MPHVSSGCQVGPTMDSIRESCEKAQTNVSIDFIQPPEAKHEMIAHMFGLMTWAQDADRQRVMPGLGHSRHFGGWAFVPRPQGVKSSEHSTGKHVNHVGRHIDTISYVT